jgi:histidinol-phosphate aminotransferase
VLRAIKEWAPATNRYPDSGCAALITELSLYYGLPQDHFAVGCGSLGLAKHLFEAVGEPGTEVVYAWRSFEAYPQLADIVGVTSVQVPLLPDESHDLEGMLAAITPATCMIIVCNPNNPTGTALGTERLVQFLDEVPSHILVVLDEAYREYVTDKDMPDGMELYSDRPNVCLLRTFSKAYGLAGLRVGFLVGHPAVAEAVRKIALPFSVNSIAQHAAIASLHASAELLASVGKIVDERSRVIATLRTQGWMIPESKANFIWLRLGADTEAFTAHCANYGIAIRAYPSEGARVSLGLPHENDAFLECSEKMIEVFSCAQQNWR